MQIPLSLYIFCIFWGLLLLFKHLIINRYYAHLRDTSAQIDNLPFPQNSGRTREMALQQFKRKVEKEEEEKVQRERGKSLADLCLERQRLSSYRKDKDNPIYADIKKRVEEGVRRRFGSEDIVKDSYPTTFNQNA